MFPIFFISGSPLDFPPSYCNLLQTGMALNQTFIQEFLTWISPNITLSGQVELRINGWTFMRALFTFTLVLVVSGCSYTLTGGRRLTPETNPKAYIGQTVTLHGEFKMEGKPGPYIQTLGAPVYLLPHGSFSWGSDYQRLEDKTVSVTGTLHFRHFEPAATANAVSQPPDYFFVDAETAKIRVK